MAPRTAGSHRPSARSRPPERNTLSPAMKTIGSVRKGTANGGIETYLLHLKSQGRLPQDAKWTHVWWCRTEVDLVKCSVGSDQHTFCILEVGRDCSLKVERCVGNPTDDDSSGTHPRLSFQFNPRPTKEASVKPEHATRRSSTLS